MFTTAVSFLGTISGVAVFKYNWGFLTLESLQITLSEIPSIRLGKLKTEL